MAHQAKDVETFITKIKCKQNSDKRVHVYVMMDQKGEWHDIDKVLQVKRYKGANGIGYVDSTIALIDIPKGTVLGQYPGFEFAAPEYDKYIKGTMDEMYHNMHVVKARFPKIGHSNQTSEMAKQILPRMASLETKLFGDSDDQYMVIDPAFAARGKGIPSDGAYMLTKIIDCRMNIFSEVQTRQDHKKHIANCILVGCTVNNWPSIFVVANKMIPVGTHLRIKYCPTFCVDVHTKMDFNKCCQINAIYSMHAKARQLMAEIKSK